MSPARRGHDGISIATEGTATGVPDILYVHANGFCKELWRPVAEAVAAEHPRSRWLSIDQRGHGDSDPGAPPYEWHPLALDVLAILGDGARGVIGVGHSMGGAALARAEILRPRTFDALVLIEPILFPPPHGRTNIPLATLALNRRSVFPDRAACHVRFSSSGPFTVWDPEVLDLYVDHAWGPGPEGWTIKCDPRVEADYYREGNNVDTWDRLGEIEVPVTLVAGELSDTHRDPYLTRLHGQFRTADLAVADGHGHLLPMERPSMVAELVMSAM